ncbi:lipopolysaccharide biosynthesis protein [Hydrogenophaga intermedia]|uniref:Polysaccharide biosynthesis protein n=1 Tax=Hydrogenophaga intermedia TaxID=65786 RepID=A0A1L1PNS3_HYDIT|nr:lipopolysaccharide biosynthesis protein [Hydrogenophaga intermedia]TMU74201.1 lipopolysaccharide biosynthesis protein [Hydrogenophaga intermedia]CDN87686.1 Polysaccharide biosynthesis protein [Hydrogenophaga intermedia]
MSFLRSVAVLVGGTALGHGITAAALPILSRLYSPADFSLLAVFASLCAMLSVAACLRFDIAIPLPQDDWQALSLLALSLASALLVSMGLLVFVLLAPDWILARLKVPSLRPYLWLIPVSVLLASVYSALQMWFVRQKSFSLLARSRVIQSTASAGVQVSFGLWTPNPAGLLIGHALNTGAACVVLGGRLLANTQQRAMLCGTTWKDLKYAWRAYERFPRYSTWEALCNSAAIQLPILLIAALAAPAEAGHLMLATYVMQAPMALIGSAVGQVYLSQAADEHRHGRLNTFTAGLLHGLVKTGAGPLLAVGILSPAAFSLVFGPQWARAGELVAWMTPWFIVQFLATPVSMALHVTGHQRAAFLMQLVSLGARVLTVWAAAGLAPQWMPETYALSGFAVYAAYLLLVLRCTQVDARAAGRIIRDNMPLLAMYALAAVAALWVLRALQST